jgi:hypothetical protein
MYMNLHPTCEACGIVESKEYHHVLTRATGGPSEDWNALDLCTICHMNILAEGRKTFASRYPRVAEKIKSACAKMGRKF